MFAQRKKMARATLAICSCLIGLSAPAARAGLIITPFFDSTVTAAQQVVINQAISFYTSSFADNINVSIEFRTGGAGGSSSASLYHFTPTQILTALHNDATANPQNTVLAGALNFFSSGNTAQQFQINAPNCRAIALSSCAGTLTGNGSVNQTALDGIVTVAANAYGNSAVTQHEINEVLGSGGWSTILGDPQTVNGLTTIAMLDPYRYSAAGTPSLTISTSATSYFSLNGGVTSIAGYNQSGNGDYGDLLSNPCYVQSFSTCANPAAQTLSSPEGLSLQTLGYDPVSTPEPTSVVLLGSALAAHYASRRRTV